MLLDFDGVLHGADAHFALHDVKVSRTELRAAGLFDHADLLARLILPNEEVRVIVHSSWRLTHTDEELRAVLGPLGGRFAGATSRALDRQASINDFVARHCLSPSQYRVLDDQVDQLGALADAVIACDPHFGLAAPTTLRLLRHWLEERPRPDCSGLTLGR